MRSSSPPFGALAAVAVIMLVLCSVPKGAEALTIEEIRSYCASLPNSTLIIGMVTRGNTELTLTRWRPTFDTYLTSGLSTYGCKTKLVPLEFDDYTTKTRDKEIDFIFPNPTAFQEMKELYDVHEFLSVKRNFGVGQQLDRFGGVIVRSSSNFTDVVNLVDINKYDMVTMCGVNENAFGGWQIQLYEMILQGVDVTKVKPVFMGSHEKSLNGTIVDKTCDFAVARTETLEREVGLGKYAESDFFTVGEKGPALKFPQHLSTVLYPEWPLASLAHVPRAIEQVIAVPLLTLDPNSAEAQAGDFAGFAFPYSYEPVRAMFIGIDKDKTGRCDPGYNRVGSNPGLCLACPPGTFSADGTIKICEPCPVGTVNNGTANVDCRFCPEGLTTVGTGSRSGMCVAEQKQKQDDKTIATSIGAGVAVLVLGASLCYVVYRNSAGVWDVFISIVSDFFLTMVSFGFEVIDILTDWFAYLQLIELNYSSSHPDLFTTYTILMAVSTIVSIANIVVRLVVAYKMAQEANTLSQARNKTKLVLADGLKRQSSDGVSQSQISGGLSTNARMNLADMAQLGAVNSTGDVTEEMLYRMDLDELIGNGITVKRLLMTRQMSIVVAVLEDIPMIILNSIVLNENPNQVIMIATFFSCILLGNKMYPLKQTFKLRHMDFMIRNVVFKRNAEIAMTSGPGGMGARGDLESHPVDKRGLAQAAAGGAGASAAAAGGVILMI